MAKNGKLIATKKHGFQIFFEDQDPGPGTRSGPIRMKNKSSVVDPDPHGSNRKPVSITAVSCK